MKKIKIEDKVSRIQFVNSAVKCQADNKYEEFLELFDDVRGTAAAGIRLALQGNDENFPETKIDPPGAADLDTSQIEFFPYKDGNGLRLDYFLKTDHCLND